MISIEQNKKLSEALILSPISVEHNKFIPRLYYQKILNDVLEVTDNWGYFIKNREGKRIIHFKKMKLVDAIEIYKEIINSDPDRYTNLHYLVNNLSILLKEESKEALFAS